MVYSSTTPRGRVKCTTMGYTTPMATTMKAYSVPVRR